MVRTRGVVVIQQCGGLEVKVDSRSSKVPGPSCTMYLLEAIGLNQNELNERVCGKHTATPYLG